MAAESTHLGTIHFKSRILAETTKREANNKTNGPQTKFTDTDPVRVRQKGRTVQGVPKTLLCNEKHRWRRDHRNASAKVTWSQFRQLLSCSEKFLWVTGLRTG